MKQHSLVMSKKSSQFSNSDSLDSSEDEDSHENEYDRDVLIYVGDKIGEKLIKSTS